MVESKGSASGPLGAARSFWLDRLWFDLVIVFAVLIVHAGLITWLSPVFDVLGNALPADRRTVYSSTAVVVSLLGSFSSIAISQLSSAKGARAEALRNQAAKTLAKNWQSVFRVGMLSALVALAALIVDPSVHSTAVLPVVARWAFEAGLLLAIVKFLRLSSLFYEIITLASISAKDPEETTLASAPTLNPDFLKASSN